MDRVLEAMQRPDKIIKLVSIFAMAFMLIGCSTQETDLTEEQEIKSVTAYNKKAQETDKQKDEDNQYVLSLGLTPPMDSYVLDDFSSFMIKDYSDVECIVAKSLRMAGGYVCLQSRRDHTETGGRQVGYYKDI